MIGKPVHKFVKAANYPSTLFNRAVNRASCLENTLTVLEDPLNNRKLYLIGTTNSSTFLAKRTQNLIRDIKPDSVYVETNQKWWDLAS